MALRHWFDRRFALGMAPDVLPAIIERLRGTPARLEERTRNVLPERLVRRAGDAWSIQENVGHLLDLEPLWAGRLDDFLLGSSSLRPTDLRNSRTTNANHNAQPLDTLLASFRTARASFVARLEQLQAFDVTRTALHPRLQQPMSVTDHAFFVAEHDDHHLARITELRKAFV